MDTVFIKVTWELYNSCDAFYSILLVGHYPVASLKMSSTKTLTVMVSCNPLQNGPDWPDTETEPN